MYYLRSKTHSLTYASQPALTAPIQLEAYIRATNPAANGPKDLSEFREGDVTYLEGSRCEIESAMLTGKALLVDGRWGFDYNDGAYDDDDDDNLPHTGPRSTTPTASLYALSPKIPKSCNVEL